MRDILLTFAFGAAIVLPTHGQYDATMLELASGLNARIESANAANVLISGFKRMDGESCELGSTLTLDLESAISEVTKTYRLLDRSNLEAMATEHKLDMQGMMDDEQSMREAGKLLKADIMVFGYFTYTPELIVLRLKAIDIQTAEQVAVITRSCPPSAMLKTLCKGAGPNDPSLIRKPKSDPVLPKRPVQAPASVYNDPECMVKQIGNYCLSNNGKVDIGLYTKFVTQYGGPQVANLLVRPGRTECFMGKPAGAYPYTLSEVYPRHPVYPTNNTKAVAQGTFQITPCGNGLLTYP